MGTMRVVLRRAGVCVLLGGMLLGAAGETGDNSAVRAVVGRGGQVTKDAVSESRPTAKGAASVEAWLDANPTVKARVVWTTEEGKVEPFADWSPAMKTRIEGFYHKLMSGTKNLGMKLPTEETANQNGAYFTPDVAFDMYAAHVAHVIYVENKHLVPWSIKERPAVELDVLLASKSYFSRILPAAKRKYPPGIEANRDFQETSENYSLGEWLGDPRVGYDFLAGKTSAAHRNLIGKTELATLVNLTAWLRDNVDHGPIDGQDRERAKNYRWLEQRLGVYPGEKMAIAIQGCHSSSKLMVDLARSVNIPLLHVLTHDIDEVGHFHGGLVYGWGGAEPRMVHHTDIIYALESRICFPMDESGTALLAPEQANQHYFDTCWRSPESQAKLGFVYHIEPVTPIATEAARLINNRADHGWLGGTWKHEGKANLPLLFEKVIAEDERCGANFLQAFVKNSKGGTVSSLIKKYCADMAEDNLPAVRPVKDQAERAVAALKLIGGPEKLAQLVQERKNARGQNLFVAK